MELPKYSIGIGDRFARQGGAQLDAIAEAAAEGVMLGAVWNKSHREHVITGSRPEDVRAEADRAVADRGWTGPYFVDADHVGLATVEPFLRSSDFFTLDVADCLGTPAGADEAAGFVRRHRGLVGTLAVPGIDEPLWITPETLDAAARKFLPAVREAGRIYRRVEEAKGAGNFVTEVSMDETDRPQTPVELLLILAGLADQGVPAQTVAPRFSGQFLKGVDYVGDVGRFAAEFEQDLAVIRFAVGQFGLPSGLKLSVHSGSDKFSLYRPMRAAMERFEAGVHLKTAGTTWLEELGGLAAAGGDGLALAKEICLGAMQRFDELCAPYAAVVRIDRAALPSAGTVEAYTGEEFAAALRHDPACASYNPHLRQLLHVAYKLAAEMGGRLTDALARHADPIAACVRDNLLGRHIRPLFLGN